MLTYARSGILYGEQVDYRTITDVFGILGLLFSTIYLVSIYQTGIFKLVDKPVEGEKEKVDIDLSISSLNSPTKRGAEAANQSREGLF